MEQIRGHVYTIHLTEEQEKLAVRTVGVVRLVYNLALEQRRTFGRKGCCDRKRAILIPPRNKKEEKEAVGGLYRKTVPTSAMRLSDELSDLRREFDWIGAVSQTAQNQALIDLDRAFKNFFEGRADFPTPRKKWQNDSFRVMGREVKIRKLNAKWSEIQIPKMGWVRFRNTRPLRKNANGMIDIRSATISRIAGGGWQVSIACMVEFAEVYPADGMSGVDRGVAVPFAISDGEDDEMVFLPKTMKKRDKAMRKAQQKLSRCTRGSKRYARARKRAAKLKARNARCRRHVSHVTSRKLARENGMVAIEALKTANMTKSAKGSVDEPGKNVAQKAGLNREILNVGWHAFETMLAYKLEETGGILIKVPAPGTSQECSECGHVDGNSRETQAIFCCTACGFTINADINAARTIRKRGLAGFETYRRGNTPLLDAEASAQVSLKRQLETNSGDLVDG